MSPPKATGNSPTSAYSQSATLQPGVDSDELGAEMAPNARVWHKYVEESDRMDKELVDGWNKTLDVILLFATLFSAISTAFVIESSRNLKPDYTEESAQTLRDMFRSLSAVSTGTHANKITSDCENRPIFSPTKSAVIVNSLWFTSLGLSVAVSLVAILAKEWCYSFIVGRVGPVLSQGRLRQQRWDGIERWKMKELLSVLPLLMHAALLLFAVGLAVYLWDINKTVAIPVVLLTTLAVLFYLVTALLSLVFRFCPYTSTLARLIRLSCIAIIQNRHAKDFLTSLIGFFFKPSDDQHEFTNHIQAARYVARSWVEKVQRTLSMEMTQAIDSETPMDIVTSSMLGWMITYCEDSRSVDLALQALAGADPSSLPRCPLWQRNAVQLVAQRLRSSLDIIKITGNSRGSEQHKLLVSCSLYSRAFKFLIGFHNGQGFRHVVGDRCGLVFEGSSRSSEEANLGLGTYLLEVLEDSSILIERLLDPCIGRADLAVFEFNNPLTEIEGNQLRAIRVSPENRRRQWNLLGQFVAGEVTLPPAALLALINGITKGCLYGSPRSPLLLIDLLRILPPEATTLRHAVGVFLTVSAFTCRIYPSETPYVPNVLPRRNIDYRRARAQEVCLQLFSKEIQAEETKALLQFGLLGLLANETLMLKASTSEIQAIGDALQTLTDVQEYNDIIPTLPHTFNHGEHLRQILSGWLGSRHSHAGYHIPQLSCLVDHAVAFPDACKVLGTRITVPLIELFLNTNSATSRKSCLHGLRHSVGLCLLSNTLGEDGWRYYEMNPKSAATAALQLGRGNFLKQLFQLTQPANLQSNTSIAPYAMRFLWNLAALILYCRRRSSAMSISLPSLLNPLFDTPINLRRISSVCELDFADLWISSLERISHADPTSLIESQILDEMISSHEADLDTYSGVPKKLAQLGDATQRRLAVLRALKERCTETMKQAQECNGKERTQGALGVEKGEEKGGYEAETPTDEGPIYIILP